jgi:hypothetical protein
MPGAVLISLVYLYTENREQIVNGNNSAKAYARTTQPTLVEKERSPGAIGQGSLSQGRGGFRSEARGDASTFFEPGAKPA